MGQIVTSSKLSLKLSCLKACDNDVKRAQQLYDFMASDLADLPDFEATPPSGLERVIGSADSVLNWVGQHQNEFAQAFALLKGLKSSTTTNGVPPIPKI